MYWLGVVGGIVTLVGAIFNCYVFYSHPAFKSGGEMAAVGVNTGADVRRRSPIHAIPASRVWRATRSPSFAQAQQSYVVNNPTVAQGAAAGVGDPEYAQDDPFSGTGVTAQPRQRGTYEVRTCALDRRVRHSPFMPPLCPAACGGGPAGSLPQPLHRRRQPVQRGQC